MKPTLERIRASRRQIEDLGSAAGISEIRIFGSVARGTAAEKSDVDFLVRVEPGRSLLDLIGFEQSVGELLRIPVEVISERGIHPLFGINHFARGNDTLNRDY